MAQTMNYDQVSSRYHDYNYLEPKWPGCFGWSLDLVLEGLSLKIEDKKVPGIYNPCKVVEIRPAKNRVFDHTTY